MLLRRVAILDQSQKPEPIFRRNGKRYSRAHAPTRTSPVRRESWDLDSNVRFHPLEKFDLGVFDHAKVIEVDRGSLGMARNDGIAQARGKYVRLCDGDDLISFNLISAMYFDAEQFGSRTILVAEWLFAFGRPAAFCFVHGSRNHHAYVDD